MAHLGLALLLLGTFGARCGGTDTPQEYKELFYLSQDEQQKRFKQFPLEKQVDVYTYAMYVEPPLTRYASYLGSSGKKVLPFLLARLEREKSDTTKSHLIYAFKEIHERYYSLKNERETVDSLSRVIINMSDEYRKKQCQGYLSIIRDSPGFNA